MKLRLPHKFQTALMAALASVSITTLSTGSTAQAAAVQITDMSSWDGYDTETGYALVGTNDGVTTKGTQGNGQQWSQAPGLWSFAITFDPTAMQAGQTYNLAALNVVQSGGSGYIEGAWLVMGENNQATFHFGAWNLADTSSTVDLTGAKDVTVVFTRDTDGKSHFYAYKDDNFSNAAVTLASSGSLSFGGTTVDTHIGALEGVTNFNNGNNKVRMPEDTSVGSYVVYTAGYTNNALPNAEELQMYHNSITTLLWNGTENSDWSSTAVNWLKRSSGEAMAFTLPGAQAIFSNAADLAKVVDVKGDLIAGNTMVEGNYTFNVGNGSSLTLGTVTIASGASFSVGDGSNLSLGTVTIASGASLAIDGSGNTTIGNLTDAGAGSLVKAGSGTATIEGVIPNGFSGSLRVEGGVLVSKGTDGNNFHDAYVAKGGTLALNASDKDFRFRTTLAGGTLSNIGGATGNGKVQNDQVSLVADSFVNAANTFYMLGGSYGATYLNLNGHTLTKTGTAIFDILNGHVDAGTIVVEGGAIGFEKTVNKNNTADVKASFVLKNAGADNLQGRFKLSGNASITALETLSASAAIELGANVTMTANVASGKTLTMSGAITGAGTIDKQGDGNLVLNGATTVAGTIANAGGNLALNGAVTLNISNISAFEVFDSTGQTYSYAAKNSGFLSTSGQYYLVKGEGGATASHGTAITGGSYVDSPTKAKGAGDIIVTFNPIGSTYYVNEDMSTTEDNSTMLGSSVKDISIKKGVTLTASASTDTFTGPAKLHGEGTYALASGANARNSGLTLGTDWTGTVRISNVSGNPGKNLHFDYFANGALSTIEFTGFVGYSNLWNGTNVQNIKLTNPTGSGVAWDATGAATTGSGTAIYSGTWSGDGTMLIAPNKLNYTFSGDISQWTGKLENRGTGNHSFNLTFTGNANAINAEIAGQNTNQMNLVVDTDATFSKKVTANTFTVNAGRTATLTSTASLAANLAGPGNVTLDNATLTLDAAGKYSGFTGTITASGANAKLVFNAADSFGGNLAQANGGVIEMYGTAARVADSNARIVVTKKTDAEMTLKEGSGQSIAKLTMVNGNSKWLFAQAIGENVEGLYTDIELAATSGSNIGLIINTANTTAHIGSLSGVSGTEVRGDYGNGAGRALVVHQNDDTTFAGAFVLGGGADRSVSLSKYGKGTLTLTGASTSTQALTVNEGTIELAGSGKWVGATTVNEGGTLSLANDITTLFGNVTVEEGGKLTLTRMGDNAVNNADRTLTLNSGATVDLTSLGLTGVDTTPVILAKGGTIAEGGLDGVTVSLGSSAVRQGKLGVQDSNLVLTYQNADLIWDNNAGGNVWNTTSKNWHTAGHDDVHIAFMSGDSVAFNESATVSLAGATEAGRMTLAEGTTLNVTANANALTMQGITLGDGSSLVVKSTIDSRNTAALQVGLGDVSVSGTGSIDTLSSGWNVEYTITDIDGAAGSILQLGESNQVIPATVYNLTGNRDDDFKGKLKVSYNVSPSAARRIAVNIQGGAETLLQFSEVELSPYNNGNSNVGLGVNTNASVMGISSEVETAGHAVIFSGQASAQGTSDFASGSTAHTLTINTAGRDFTSGAKILAQINLLKDGEGTQRFTGDLSAMNGTVGVQAGTLALTNTGASAGTLASATVDGGALQLGNMNVSGAVTVTSGSLAFSDAASAASVSVAAGGSLMLGSGLTTTGNMTVGNGATLNFNASAPLTIGGNLELGENITYNIGGVRHAGEYTVASAGGTLTFGTPGSVNLLGSSLYGGTLSQKGNDLVLNVQQTGKVLHLLLLTGQSNSLGAVKADPASAGMLAEYAPHTIQMWDGNMSGSVSDPSADTKNKAWQDEGKQWFTVQQQSTPTGKDAYGPANTPYENLKGGANLVSNWGGNFVMGPEYGFSYMMEKRGWNMDALNTTSIIKVSRDGGANTFWDPTNASSICPQIKDTVVKAILAADAGNYDAVNLDGLMFLQGESSNAGQGDNVKNVLTSMISWLQDELAREMQQGGRLEGVSDKLTVSIGDTVILGEPAGTGAGSQHSTAVYKQWAEQNPAQAGLVYAHDLTLISAGDNLNLHYDGNSQITIGARYAYAMAQVQGLDTTQGGTVRVRSQAYGDAMLGESSVALNDDAAWWKSSGDKTAYSAASLASTVAVWDVSSAHMANGERITGNLALGGIRIEDPYSDDENPGDHQATITINSDSTDHVLSLGSHGIELQQGDLTIGANVNATANQSWNTVYTPEGGTARTNHLAVTGTVTIGENVLLTFKEGSHIRFNSIVGTGSLTIGNGVTLAMSQADVDLKGGHYTEDENGFRTENTVLIELTGDTSAITADLTQLRFEDALADQDIMLSDDRKSLLLDTTTSKTFHVRDSVVEYSADHPDILQAKSIGIHDMGGTGATLVLKQNLPGGDEPVTIVASGTGGTVVIDSGVSLNASAVDAASSALTIAGSGEYVGHAIGAVGTITAADVLGQGVSLAGNWTGKVVVSGGHSAYTAPYTILDPLAGIGSSLVLNGVYGYFSTTMSVSNDIEFRGTEEGGTGTALTYTAGNNKTLTLNGKISGSGDFFYNKAGNSAETVVMNGDIAEWSGTLRLGTQANGSLSLTLGTGVTEANFNITRDSGSGRGLTLKVNGAQEVDFNGTIGGTAAFTKDGTGTLTLNAANTYSGGTTVSAGTLKTTGTGTGIKSLGTGAVTIGADGTLDVANNLRIDGLLTNSAGGTLRLEDESVVELYASGGGRTYNIGKVALNGSATIMNRWNGATLNVASILGGASDTLVLKTNQSSSGSTWNIGSDSGAADNFKGTLVLQVADSDADNNRTATYNFKDGGMFSSATLELQDGPYKTTRTTGTGMTNNIVLADSEVKFGGINDLPMEGGHTRPITWTVKSNSNTDARTLVLDAESGSYTTKAGIDARVNIQKTGASEQTFTGSTANFNGNVDVEAGVLNIMNATSLNVKDVTIGAGATMGVYKNGTATEANEGKVTIERGYTLSAGNLARLNSDLEMAHGSRLDVSQAQVGSTGSDLRGLIMGSSVTIQGASYENGQLVAGTGVSLVYTDNLGVQHDAMADVDGYLRDYFSTPGNQYYVLFDSVEELYLNGATEPSGEIAFNGWDKPFMDANTLFNNVYEKTYAVVYTMSTTEAGGNVGMVAICMVPEPTTGTLSLLALAALAARRRRK